MSVWQKYATFSGRARRAEYWYFQLFNMVAVALIAFVAISGSFIAMGLLFVYILASLLPSLAVTVRRLHDIDFSGWWILISLIPFGGLVLFFFTVMAGTKGPNRFGEDPIKDNAVSPIPTAPAATASAPEAAAIPATTSEATPTAPAENNPAQ